MNFTPRDLLSQRRRDIEHALASGAGYRTLARRWGLSIPGAWGWARRNATDAELETLALNGRLEGYAKISAKLIERLAAMRKPERRAA